MGAGACVGLNQRQGGNALTPSPSRPYRRPFECQSMRRGFLVTRGVTRVCENLASLKSSLKGS